MWKSLKKIATLGVVSALFLAGCSSEPDEPDDSTVQTDPTSESQTPPEAQTIPETLAPPGGQTL